MTKAQEKVSEIKEAKEKKIKDKEHKDKNGDALVGRVKKVIKKSRRKLSEEKFEKQLQRTIAFLEELQAKLGESHLPINKGNGQKKIKNDKKTKSNNSTRKSKAGTTTVKSGMAASAKAE